MKPRSLEDEWLEIFRAADSKRLKISEKDIYDEVQAHRGVKGLIRTGQFAGAFMERCFGRTKNC